MKLAIMQPYLFPYIGYFQLINAVDKFILYDDVNFIKQGWINRNRILIAGNVGYITIPLKNASSFTPINTVEIQNTNGANWRTKLLKSIQQSYGKSANFSEIYPLVEAVIQHECESISKLAAHSITTICSYLDIKTPIQECSTYHSDTKHLHAEQRVLAICLKENSQKYINPIGGVNLYSRENFRAKNIDLQFIQSKAIAYKQPGKEFHPWLSIIDVLMHNSKNQAQQFLVEYQLA